MVKGRGTGHADVDHWVQRRSLNTQPVIVSLAGKPFPFQGFDAEGILEWLGGTPFCLPTTGSNNGPGILTLVEVAGQCEWVAIWQEEKYRLHFQKWRSQSGTGVRRVFSTSLISD